MARLDLSLLGARFEFQSASRRLLNLVNWAFADLPAHRFAGSVPRIRIRLGLSHSESVAGGRQSGDPPGMRLHSGAGLLGAVCGPSSYVALSPGELSGLVVVAPEMLTRAYHVRYELIEFATFTLVARALGLTPLHAACVGRRGRGLLLLGDSGAGKSTLTLHCLLNDFEFIAEDSVFVQPHALLATGAANFLHLRADSLRFLPARERSIVQKSPVIRRRSGVEKFEVDVRHMHSRAAPRPLRLAGVVFATGRSSDSGPQLRRLGNTQARRRLMATQPYGAGQPGWADFSRSVAHVPMYELSRGEHPAQAVALLGGLL